MIEKTKKYLAIILSVVMVCSISILLPDNHQKHITASVDLADDTEVEETTGDGIFEPEETTTLGEGITPEEITTELETEEPAQPKEDINNAQIQIETQEVYTYTGAEIKPKVIVVYDEFTLSSDTDYTVMYENNINVGTAKINITGIGQYEGTVTKEFTITQKDLTDSDITVDASNLGTFAFNGKDRTPIVTIKYNGKVLNPMADFTVKYSNNFYPGTATVTLEGIDNFKGQVVKTFKITKTPIGNVTIRTSFNTAKQLVVTVNNGSYGMTKGKDYTYTAVTDSLGNITITFQGLGSNYTGTYVVKIAADDNPNKPVPPTVKRTAFKKAKNIKSKKIKITWKKISGAAGYEIAYSTNKNFKKKKTTTITKKTNKYIIKKLKLKTKYYIRVRAYKVFNGKNYYGNWSKKAKIKVKK